jgi:hypothetical protein
MFEEQSPLQQVGGGQQMSPEEVIRQAAPRQAPDIPVEQVLQSIQQEAQLPDAIFEQYGNTIFVAHMTQEGVAVFRALNADTPQNYIHATKQFFDMMRENGIRYLVTTFKDPAIINIAAGVDKMYADDAAMGYQVDQTSDGGFRMGIDLGGPI